MEKGIPSSLQKSTEIDFRANVLRQVIRKDVVGLHSRLPTELSEQSKSFQHQRGRANIGYKWSSSLRTAFPTFASFFSHLDRLFPSAEGRARTGCTRGSFLKEGKEERMPRWQFQRTHCIRRMAHCETRSK